MSGRDVRKSHESCTVPVSAPLVNRKAQTEKRSLTGRQIAWMVYDFFKICGDNEAIFDFRDLSKVQLKNDKVHAFDTKWDEVLSAVTE